MKTGAPGDASRKYGLPKDTMESWIIMGEVPFHNLGSILIL